MNDEADNAAEHIEREEAAAIKAIQAKRAAQPEGVAGKCDLCGEWMLRLVDGACAPCRDRYKLP
jgi:hypothetical protein